MPIDSQVSAQSQAGETGESRVDPFGDTLPKPTGPEFEETCTRARPGPETLVQRRLREALSQLVNEGRFVIDPFSGESGQPVVARDKIGTGGMGDVYDADIVDLSELAAHSGELVDVVRSDFSAMRGSIDVLAETALQALPPILRKNVQQLETSNGDVVIKVNKPHAEPNPDEMLIALNVQEQVPTSPRIYGGGVINNDGQQRFIIMQRLHGYDGLQLNEHMQQLSMQAHSDVLCHEARNELWMHKARLTHADQKPQNTMMCQDGLVRPMDFGLSAYGEADRFHMEGAAQMSGENSQGGVAGTPKYMSPEQASGQRPTSHSDIFTLGAMWFERLTGEPIQVAATVHQLAIKRGSMVGKPFSEAIIIRNFPENEDARMKHYRQKVLPELIRSMLHGDPAQRPNALEVFSCTHAFSSYAGQNPTSIVSLTQSPNSDFSLATNFVSPDDFVEKNNALSAERSAQFSSSVTEDTTPSARLRSWYAGDGSEQETFIHRFDAGDTTLSNLLDSPQNAAAQAAMNPPQTGDETAIDTPAPPVSSGVEEGTVVLPRPDNADSETVVLAPEDVYGREGSKNRTIRAVVAATALLAVAAVAVSSARSGGSDEEDSPSDIGPTPTASGDQDTDTGTQVASLSTDAGKPDVGTEIQNPIVQDPPKEIEVPEPLSSKVEVETRMVEVEAADGTKEEVEEVVALKLFNDLTIPADELLPLRTAGEDGEEVVGYGFTCDLQRLATLTNVDPALGDELLTEHMDANGRTVERGFVIKSNDVWFFRVGNAAIGFSGPKGSTLYTSEPRFPSHRDGQVVDEFKHGMWDSDPNAIDFFSDPPYLEATDVRKIPSSYPKWLIHPFKWARDINTNFKSWADVVRRAQDQQPRNPTPPVLGSVERGGGVPDLQTRLHTRPSGPIVTSQYNADILKLLDEAEGKI